MSKELILIKDLINKYHPLFKESRWLRKYAIEQPSIFNIEKLVEESLAAVGGYKFVDAYGYDFDDLSDSKTITVRSDGQAQINSVENKVGSLRVIIYNKIAGRLDYMFIPSIEVNSLSRKTYGKDGQNGKLRMIMRYTPKKDYYNMFERFRVANFIELATAKEKKGRKNVI